MKVDNFANQFQAGDLARNNLFEVSIGLHSRHAQQDFYNSGDSTDIDDLRFMIKDAQLPGKSLGVVESRRFGAVDKHANDVILDNATWTVMCSEDLRERAFFEGWINWIHGRGVRDSSSALYRYRYHDEYVSNINIQMFNRRGEPSTGVTLYEAFPVNIGAVELSWVNEGSFSTFTVSIAFKDWKEFGAD